MNSSTSPSDPSENLSHEKIAILIKRNTKKTPNELSISYDTKPIDKYIENEEERAILLKFIKNILLSCNDSYLIYATNKIFNYLKSLFFYNLVFFLFINILLKWVYKEKSKKDQAPLWKKLILFNLPELLIIFIYYRKKYSLKSQYIFFLFSYLNERISYVFNNDTNNNYLCQIDQRNYDIYLIKKNEDIQKIQKNFYLINEETLSKDTFFDNVISYPNANFEDFDFNNLEQIEEEMFQDIFTLINEIEKKIKEDNKLLNTISSFIGNLSYTNSTNYNILYALLCKIGNFLISEIFLNNYENKSQRKKLIEQKTKVFNHKNMGKGYFLALNEDVILLFKIKDKYKSFDESYSILYKDSQNLLNQNFYTNINKFNLN